MIEFEKKEKRIQNDVHFHEVMRKVVKKMFKGRFLSQPLFLSLL